MRSPAGLLQPQPHSGDSFLETGILSPWGTRVRFTSPDGINWTQTLGDGPATASTATLRGVAYSSTLQRFVIVGTGGTILVSNPPRTVFGNASTRGYVSNTETFIGGFVIEGTAPRTVLIRADGPVLSQFSVPSPLPDPVLTVYDNEFVVATNTGCLMVPPASSHRQHSRQEPSPCRTPARTGAAADAPARAYTAQITSAKGNSGTALFEAYSD